MIFKARVASLSLCTALITTSAWAHGPHIKGRMLGDPPTAQKAADELLPASLDGPAREPAKAVIDRLKIWKTGTTLSVCFFPGNTAALNKIAQVANVWTKFANLKLDFGPPDRPHLCTDGGQHQISVGFLNDGYWSYVGTDSRKYSPSLNLEGMDFDDGRIALAEFTRLVLHEFGHALGLEHEHQSPESRCSEEIDWPAAAAYYKSCCDWTAAEVKRNVEALVASKRYRTTAYDPKSIMHYALPIAIFENGRHSRCYTSENYELSPIDKTAIAQTYPSDMAQQQQRINGDVQELDSLLQKAGVSAAERASTLERVAKHFSITTLTVTGSNNTVIQGDVNQSTTGQCGNAVIGPATVNCNQPSPAANR